MNILFIKHFFVGFMVSEIPRVSVFGHCPYSVTFPYVIKVIIFKNFWGNAIRTCCFTIDKVIIYSSLISISCVDNTSFQKFPTSNIIN